MKLEQIRIPNGEGSLSIAGLRYTPDLPYKPIGVVLAHGFTSAKHSMDPIAAYISERGYDCLAFDAVGHKLGCTGGRMEHISQAADNLRVAAAWLRANSEARRIALIGHSMGASAAIQVAARAARNPAEFGQLCGIACLCMGINPASSFDSPLGKSMLAQRSSYVEGAPVKQLLEGLSELLEGADEIGPLPALMIAARNDILLPVSAVTALAGRIGPSAVVKVLEAMHLDAPERSRGALYNWLEELRAGLE